jgi:hypothetical protein
MSAMLPYISLLRLHLKKFWVSREKELVKSLQKVQKKLKQQEVGQLELEQLEVHQLDVKQEVEQLEM